jgi:hypothetical protein
MKIKPVYFIALGLALALTVAVCDGIRIRDKYSISIGNYQAALDHSKQDEAALTLQIAKANEIVGQQNAIIIERDKTIGHLTNTIGQQDADLVTLGGRLAQAKTDTDRVPILTAMVENWRAKYSTATLIIGEKDKVIEAWAAKYAAQVTISESWKAKYDAECRIRHLAEQGWKASESKLRWTRIVGNVKSGAIVAAAGYIIFNVIKGTA